MCGKNKTDERTDLEQFFNEFNKIPDKKRRNESFISICGFPSREKVSSNILSFFLDTNREHQLKNLFVKSLLESIGLNADDYPEDFTAETEVYTKTGHYIDLLLRNERINIIIENKIYAGLYNKLDDYYETASEEDKAKPIGIVLSLYPQDKKPDNYYCVTYRSFFCKIKENIRYYLESANKKYLPFMWDYFDNIESLERRDNMDKEFLEFLRNHKEKAIEFTERMEEFRKNLRNIVKSVNQSLVEKIKDKNVKIWAYREMPNIFDMVVVDYCPDSNTDIALDSCITLDGWDFTLWIRSDKFNKANLGDYIRKIGLNGKGKIDERGRFKFDKTYKFDASIEDVSDFIASIINLLN